MWIENNHGNNNSDEDDKKLDKLEKESKKLKSELSEGLKELESWWKTGIKVVNFIIKTVISGLLLLKGNSPFKIRKIQKAVWLSVDSIIANEIHYPNEEIEWGLSIGKASAWLWEIYDFHNERELKGVKWNYLHDVRLMMFEPDAVKDNLKSDLTPTELCDLFDIRFVLTFTKFSINKALDSWIIEEKTLYEAFWTVWKEELQQQVKVLEIWDAKVYQVTPKWNGLIYPFKNGGNKKSKKKIESKLEESHSLWWNESLT